MIRITSVVIAGIAGFIVISTVAEAADGCGRGMYYNGRRRVPQVDDGYGYRPGANARTTHRRTNVAA